jgi:hypothetical protein
VGGVGHVFEEDVEAQGDAAGGWMSEVLQRLVIHKENSSPITNITSPHQIHHQHPNLPQKTHSRWNQGDLSSHPFSTSSSDALVGIGAAAAAAAPLGEASPNTHSMPCSTCVG